MPSESPKEHGAVLVVEDCDTTRLCFEYQLERGAYTVLQSDDIEEALRLFNAHALQIRGVLLDGCVPGNVINTIPLLRHMRTSFRGPIVAISSDEGNRAVLVEEGCSHSCEKCDGATTLMSVLRDEAV